MKEGKLKVDLGAEKIVLNSCGVCGDCYRIYCLETVIVMPINAPTAKFRSRL